jgi:hypothetical protein
MTKNRNRRKPLTKDEYIRTLNSSEKLPSEMIFNMYNCYLLKFYGNRTVAKVDYELEVTA